MWSLLTPTAFCKRQPAPSKILVRHTNSSGHYLACWALGTFLSAVSLFKYMYQKTFATQKYYFTYHSSYQLFHRCMKYSYGFMIHSACIRNENRAQRSKNLYFSNTEKIKESHRQPGGYVVTKPQTDRRWKEWFFYITGADTEMALLDKHRNYRSRAEKE